MKIFYILRIIYIKNALYRLDKRISFIHIVQCGLFFSLNRMTSIQIEQLTKIKQERPCLMRRIGQHIIRPR